jgi:hypothetical protein
MFRKIISQTIVSVLFLVFSLCIIACTGLPERKNADDTVGVLKVTRIFKHASGEIIEKPSDYMASHVNYMHIDDSKKGYLVDQSDSHIYLTGLEPGPHMITYVTRSLINSYAGADETVRVAIPFKLEAGHATILEFSFDYIIRYEGDRVYFWEGFNPLKPEV